jgi:undecaprenyl-diphosphatase
MRRLNGLAGDARRLDTAVYRAVARTRTPTLDRPMGAVSRSANYSRLWFLASALLAWTGKARGRRAAVMGLASVAVTSFVVNLVMKPLAHRRRPDRKALGVPLVRQVRMPRSTSFPSGHAASAFAFATGVGFVMPRQAVGLRALAAVVAFSRVYTGVHYPGDVLLGALIGTSCAQLTARAVQAAAEEGGPPSQHTR